VQVDFDPHKISYSQLLDIFWNSHDPTDRNWSRQYQNVIFYENGQQKRQAMASLAARQKMTKGEIRSQVLPLCKFYLAEDYHQKYSLQQYHDLMRELSRIYPEKKKFIDSTAVTRINSYLGGYGSPEQLDRELDDLGLSPGGSQILHKLASGRHSKGRF
jgi:peptide-methionine (S)-S-oxide reductase